MGQFEFKDDIPINNTKKLRLYQALKAFDGCNDYKHLMVHVHAIQPYALGEEVNDINLDKVIESEQVIKGKAKVKVKVKKNVCKDKNIMKDALKIILSKGGSVNRDYLRC